MRCIVCDLHIHGERKVAVTGGGLEIKFERIESMIARPTKCQVVFKINETDTHTVDCVDMKYWHD